MKKEEEIGVLKYFFIMPCAASLAFFFDIIMVSEWFCETPWNVHPVDHRLGRQAVVLGFWWWTVFWLRRVWLCMSMCVHTRVCACYRAVLIPGEYISGVRKLGARQEEALVCGCACMNNWLSDPLCVNHFPRELFSFWSLPSLSFSYCLNNLLFSLLLSVLHMTSEPH